MDMIKPSVILTKRLTLRCVVDCDVSYLFNNYTSDPECTRFLTRLPHIKIEQTEQFLEKWCIQSWSKESNNFAWIVALSSSNEAIGVFIVDIENHKAQIHYGIGKRFWGNGFVTEACYAVTEWLSQHPQIQKIWAVCDLLNVGTIKVLEKVQYQKEGLLRNWLILPAFGESARDCLVYSRICSMGSAG